MLGAIKRLALLSLVMAVPACSDAYAAGKFIANAALTLNTFPTSGQTMTVTWWGRWTVINTDQTIISFRDAGGSGNSTLVENPSSNGVVELETPGKNVTCQTISLGNWYPYAFSINGTGTNNVNFYCGPAGGVNGSTALTTNAATDATVPATYDTAFIGKDASGDNFTGDVAYYKLYNAVLTADEIRSELMHGKPYRVANLALYLPLFNGTDAITAYLGHGANATAGSSGVTTSTQGPPIAYQ